jgi:nitric oxide synthase-interacting protein
MSRHSKNATATTHFTYHEKQAAGHGTLKRRFGKDSQLPFGFCCLCVASTFEKEPMVSPSGFLYCKECIYSNLLAQKRTIQENLTEYERFCEKKEQEAQEKIIENERKQLKQFLEGGLGVVPSINKLKEQDAKAKLLEKMDRRTEEEKRKAMQKTSFWIAEMAPSIETKVTKPDTKTRDPMSNEEMKLKHLMPVKFEWEEVPKSKNRHAICTVTKKEITHQQTVLIRPSGQILLESCLQDMVLPTMTCPITGLKLRKKDIIKLQAGGTGFSAHSAVEAKKYRPTMT